MKILRKNLITKFSTNFRYKLKRRITDYYNDDGSDLTDYIEYDCVNNTITITSSTTTPTTTPTTNTILVTPQLKNKFKNLIDNTDFYLEKYDIHFFNWWSEVAQGANFEERTYMYEKRRIINMVSDYLILNMGFFDTLMLQVQVIQIKLEKLKHPMVI